MLVVFEGSKNQVDNLIELSKLSSERLPSVRDDIQTSNLWSIEDIKNRFECSNDVAMDILVDVLSQEKTIQFINEEIQELAENLSLREK